MQIQLKQREIEAALKGYITKQGIDLTGRTITIDFTAGRKDSGLTADLRIEDEEIPGYSNQPDTPHTPASTPVGNKELPSIAVVKVFSVQKSDEAPPAATSAPAAEPPVSTAAPGAKSGVSLFN